MDGYDFIKAFIVCFMRLCGCVWCAVFVVVVFTLCDLTSFPMSQPVVMSSSRGFGSREEKVKRANCGFLVCFCGCVCVSVCVCGRPMENNSVSIRQRNPVCPESVRFFVVEW